MPNISARYFCGVNAGASAAMKALSNSAFELTRFSAAALQLNAGVSRMTQRILYFAYGSNMALERLRSRVPSAEWICCGCLCGHQLKFHKRGRSDGSGKCDAEHTGNPKDKVLGVIYSIRSDELPFLDKVEGRGLGYDRRTVKVTSGANEALDAETYIATDVDSRLRPFDWYKEHVLRGARAAALPADYIASIDAVIVDTDLDNERRSRELGIYG